MDHRPRPLVHHVLGSAPDHGQGTWAIRDFSGAITVPENRTPSVSVSISVGSVNTGNPARDEHLRAPDIFGIDEFPTATLVSVYIRRRERRPSADADFTLRGITKRVPLAFSFLGMSPGMGHGEVSGFEGVIKLKRSDFGVLRDAPVLTGGGPARGHRRDLRQLRGSQGTLRADGMRWRTSRLAPKPRH